MVVRRVAAGIAGLLLLSGCAAAQVGQTDLTLHQRAVFADGTRYELDIFGLSEVKNDQPNGPLTLPGNELTVSIRVQNAGPPLAARDVVMAMAYRGEQNQELVPPPVGSVPGVIASGAKGKISKTFRVENTTELFRTRYLRVEVELPGHPAVTFSGSIP